MLFKTTEEHEALRMQVREFVETEVKPIAAILDKENKFPPSSRVYIPKRHFIMVDFPAPFSPMSPITEPCLTVRFIPSKTLFFPKDFERFFISRTTSLIPKITLL